ncbi:MAG: trypsin-like peptidase domain-containing protein [Lachnospiraceae bacterium]|nr:trypsin-like peptidase domain-containing protein [Lachnospiraceae bacterium]
MKKKTFRILAVLLTLSLLLAGCDIEKGTPVSQINNTGSSTGNNTDITATPEVTETATPTPNPKTALTFEEIEQLAAECSFHVHWYTEDDDFSAGTAFILDSKVHGQKLLVTAFHFLVPDDDDGSFKGSDLPASILGGEVSYAKTGEDTGARLKNCLVIEDAAAVPALDKDVAAFTLYNGQNLKALPLAEDTVTTGDKLYLLANLWDTDDVHENCVYECTAFLDQDYAITYKLDPKYGTTGASGGPVINKYGEVVGIHMASGGDLLYSHASRSFIRQIDAATISDITYPEDLSEYKGEPTDGPQQIYHQTSKVAETLFFDMTINSAEISDTYGDEVAPEGMKFLTLDITCDSTDIYDSDLNLYYYDFTMVWSGGYDASYRLLSGDVADEFFTVKANAVTNAKVVFQIPEDPKTLTLFYVDYYMDDDNEMHEIADHYFDIPVEGF